MPEILSAAYHDVVSALVYTLAAGYEGPNPAGLPFNDLTAFILRQQARMPDYLRGPMLAATVGLDLAVLARNGHRFHTQSPANRRRQVDFWRNSRMGPVREVVRYYESLATLALHSRETPPVYVQPVSIPTTPVGNVLSEPGRDLRCEVAVVGSGPGGAITACLLAESGRDVLLIEEGPLVQLDSCSPFSREEMEQKYRNGGQTVALGRTKVAYVEGCCVGGGSEINSGLYHRTPPEVLERWRKEFRVADLTEADLRPHFESCEREVSVSPLPGPAPAASMKLHEGAVRLGWKSLEVPRWFRYDGSGAAGTRQTMTQTYIPRFLEAGGRLVPGTRVHRLQRKGNGWLIRATHGGALDIRAQTVFLCAGAVQTPALLRHSGITSNVGDTLQLHPTVKVVARFPGQVNASDMGVPVHQVKEFSPRISLGCSISSPAYLALGLLDHPTAAAGVRGAWARMANYYAMITAEARGTVRRMPGFRDALVRYALTENDRRQLAEGLHKLCEALFAAGAEALFPSLARVPQLTSPDDLCRLPAVLPEGLPNVMTIHVFSSCPLGEDRARCAVDSYGRMHGFNDLFVGDASLLCSAPGVNPQGTIMALVRRNTLRFLKKC
jgi:choline dehydrogenase-like flavoprotein